MSTRAIRGPFRFDTWKKVTANYTVVNEAVIEVDTTNGAVTITLPPSVAGTLQQIRDVLIIDVGGAAATHNITVSPNGTDTINGASSLTISANYAVTHLYDCGPGAWIKD